MPVGPTESARHLAIITIIVIVVIEHPTHPPENYERRLHVPWPGGVKRTLPVWPFRKPPFSTLTALLPVLVPVQNIRFDQSPVVANQSLNDRLLQASKNVLEVSDKPLTTEKAAIAVANLVIFPGRVA